MWGFGRCHTLNLWSRYSAQITGHFLRLLQPPPTTQKCYSTRKPWSLSPPLFLPPRHIISIAVNVLRWMKLLSQSCKPLYITRFHLICFHPDGVGDRGFWTREKVRIKEEEAVFCVEFYLLVPIQVQSTLYLFLFVLLAVWRLFDTGPKFAG